MAFGLLIDASQTASGQPEWITRFDPDVHARWEPAPEERGE